MLRDRLQARMREMGPRPDYRLLAAEVLGIANAPPELARRLVAQALVLEDRREAWSAAGGRIAARAPDTPGVYVLRDVEGRALYVGKAVNLRRRLRAHFAGRRWRGVKAGFARAADGEWQEVGSELEALLLEARLIHELAPEVNVQIAEPALETRAVPPQLVRDVVIVLPSIEPDSAEIVAARARGDCLMLRTRRSGVDLVVHVPRLTRFFTSPLRRSFDGLKLAPIVFSWLADRGRLASRLDPHDAAGPRAFRARLKALLADEALFSERIVMR